MPDTFDAITFRDDLHGYLINRKGEIYSLHTHKIMTPQVNCYGYIQYTLRSDSGIPVRITAHIAVAYQYIPNDDPKHKTIVNHLDENKQNPSADNLEWTTPMGNVHHGTCIERSVGHRKKAISEYDLDGKYIRTWASATDVIEFYADYVGCDKREIKYITSGIYACCKGELGSAYGRVWRYTNTGDTGDIAVDKMLREWNRHSINKFSLDYTGIVPDKYLFHKPSIDEIVDYFRNHERLNDFEKQLFDELIPHLS